MPKIEFTPQGLDAQWPARRWLDFLDGPATGPPTGVWLGYADESASLYVETYPQPRFEAAMVRRGDDPFREVALTATFQQINRILFQFRHRKTRRDDFVQHLKQYAEERAHEYPAWHRAQWQRASAPGRE